MSDADTLAAIREALAKEAELKATMYRVLAEDYQDGNPYQEMGVWRTDRKRWDAARQDYGEHHDAFNTMSRGWLTFLLQRGDEAEAMWHHTEKFLWDANKRAAAAEAECERLREALADFDDFLADAFNAGIGAGHPLDSGHSRRGYEAERDALRAKHAAALAARPEEEGTNG